MRIWMSLLAACLCLCLCLCACGKQPEAQLSPLPQEEAQTPAKTTAPVASVPTASPVSSSNAPQTESPAAPQTAEPSPLPTAAPVDLSAAAPLLNALAEALVLEEDGTMDFERYPTKEAQTALFARLIRDGADEDLNTLYPACFSEGSYEAVQLPESLPDKGELQFSTRLNGWEDLGDGYYQLEMQLFWAWPEDAQATAAGMALIWVKENESSPYGLGLAKIEGAVSLRPGDDFGAHPARDVEQIMPMLHAVLKACWLTGDGFTGEPSDRFAFEAAYTLLNDHGEDFGLSGGKSAKISRQTMQNAMHALFGPSYKTPDKLPSGLSAKLKADGGGYLLTYTREETAPVFADYRVTMNAMEIITVSLRVGEGTDESPWAFVGAADVSVNTADGLPYRSRYAEDISFTPQP